MDNQLDRRDGATVPLKRTMRKFWTFQPPGMRAGITQGAPGTRAFYEGVDRERYRDEPYILPLLDAVTIPGGRVLDVGCGLGADLRQFSRRGMKAIGVDLSPNNARLSKLGFRVMGLDSGTALPADAENLPFRDGTFDLVYSYAVVHHTPNTEKAIGELHRVLRTGGRAAFMIYHKGAGYYWVLLVHGLLRLKFGRRALQEQLVKHYDRSPHAQWYSMEDAAALLSRFDNVRAEAFGFFAQGADRWRWVARLFHRSGVLRRWLSEFLIIHAEKAH